MKECIEMRKKVAEFTKIAKKAHDILTSLRVTRCEIAKDNLEKASVIACIIYTFFCLSL